jgi:hypothetical protein
MHNNHHQSNSQYFTRNFKRVKKHKRDRKVILTLQASLQLGLVLDLGARLSNLNTISLQQLLCLSLLSLVLLSRLLAALVLVAAHLLQVHLIRAVGQTQRSDASPHVRQGSLLRDTSTSVCLDGSVDDVEGSLGDEHLGFGNLLESLLGASLVDLDGGVEDDESGGIDFDTGLGDPFEDDAVLAEELAKGLLLLVIDAHEHPVESLLSLLKNYVLAKWIHMAVT